MDQDNQVTPDADFLQEMENLLSQHDYEQPRVGDIRQAIIVSISPQGIIVDLGLKRDGIVQSSDLDKLDPGEREGLAVNDEIPVYIVSVDSPDSLQVSLHLARLNEDWIRAQEMLDSGEILETQITGHNRGGALVPFGRLRGFIPASHLSFINPGMNEHQRQQRIAEAHGETVPVKIIEVDRRRRRLVLSHREAERVWQEKRRRELLEQLNEGDVLRGKVTGWRDFGAFVDLGGADGLIHVSELAWQRVEHPKEVVRMGEEVEVYVLKVDRKRERISLSRKKLLQNPWTTVAERYDVGQLVEGRVIRVVDYGAFVEVEPGVEGLLHTSQISRSNIDNPRDVLREGETHLLRIISIDAERQRIGLSLKAVTAAEQIDWMTRREQEYVVDAEGTDDRAEVVEMESKPEEVASEEPDVVEMEAEPEEVAGEEPDVVEMEAEPETAAGEEPDVVEPEEVASEEPDVVEMEAELEAAAGEEPDVVEMGTGVSSVEPNGVAVSEGPATPEGEHATGDDEAGQNDNQAATLDDQSEPTEESGADVVPSA
ncbi:MAG: S1 RNA-binding domain-containing protein [Anaerolineae bacterium]|nr:S1 RNA-binding domain-containing protein [Anaerolineae bacterium]